MYTALCEEGNFAEVSVVCGALPGRDDEPWQCTSGAMWQNLGHVAEDESPTRAERPVLQRLAFIDALRLLAALQMIVGHTLDALLDTRARLGPGYAAWTFARGLTSTAFFAAAGLSFVLAYGAAPDRAGRRRRLGRAAELVLVGFVLRAPLGIVWGEPMALAWSHALQPDVLHVMGLALGVSEFVFYAVAQPRARLGLALGLGCACFLAAGPLAHALADAPCTVWRSALSPACGATFPLLPWLGYPLCALAAGVFCLAPAGRIARRLAVLAALTLGAAWALRYLVPGGWSRLSPAFMALKLGLVFAIAALLAVALRERRLPATLQKLASETLFLYGSHVLVLYAGRVGLSTLIGPRLPLWGALLAAFGLSAGAALGSLSYRSLVPALRRGKHGGTPRAQRRPSPPG